MKESILTRIEALGGDISNVKGISLAEDLQSIKFNTVLYPKPEDEVPQTDNPEPIIDLGEYIAENIDLYNDDEETFYKSLIDRYYRDTEEGFGQMFYWGILFTPLKKGTDDYDEWFENNVDFSEIKKVVGDGDLVFIQVMYSYGFPDSYYVCLSDPDQDNPKIFGIDSEETFYTNEGKLEDFLNSFMTKDEFLLSVKLFLKKIIEKLED